MSKICVKCGISNLENKVRPVGFLSISLSLIKLIAKFNTNLQSVNIQLIQFPFAQFAVLSWCIWQLLPADEENIRNRPVLILGSVGRIQGDPGHGKGCYSGLMA